MLCSIDIQQSYVRILSYEGKLIIYHQSCLNLANIFHELYEVGDKQFHIINNFRNAFRGIFMLIREGQIFRVHLLLMIAVIVAGILFRIDKEEWLIIILTIGVVLAAEGFNTAIEKLCDHISPDYHMSIKKVKDFAAAAVLLTSISAAVLGLLIFIPYLIEWLKSLS